MILLMSLALTAVVSTSLWISANSGDDRNRHSTASRLSSAFLPQRAIVVAERRNALHGRRGRNGQV